ncbi:MAG: hypothetical protein LBN12_09130 [Clostridiales Family XIII bacterium]|jgi:uncharacterized membrane protein|nr:hypothetical protein [Clostridiales Family XIII bacterium]
MVEILNNEKGPFQVLFGDDASADINVVVPIVFGVVIVLIIVAFVTILKSKGRSDMTEEERKADQELVDERMRKQAALAGEVYVPDRARQQEQEEIDEARRRWGRTKN